MQLQAPGRRGEVQAFLQADERHAAFVQLVDRRHDVRQRAPEPVEAADGGDQHVAAYLHDFDLSDFDPKAPRLKTAAFWDVVDANRAPEDAELADVLDALGKPIAVTLADLVSQATPSLADWLRDGKNARQVPHRTEAVGYVAVRNDATKDGLWVVDQCRQAIYVRRELGQDRVVAAQLLSQRRR